MRVFVAGASGAIGTRLVPQSREHRLLECSRRGRDTGQEVSDQNIELIQSGIDAFNRRDFDAALARLREDVTWEPFLSRTEADSPVVRGRSW